MFWARKHFFALCNVERLTFSLILGRFFPSSWRFTFLSFLACAWRGALAFFQGFASGTVLPGWVRLIEWTADSPFSFSSSLRFCCGAITRTIMSKVSNGVTFQRRRRDRGIGVQGSGAPSSFCYCLFRAKFLTPAHDVHVLARISFSALRV